MEENRNVKIILESVLDGDSTTHAYEGEWFRKERSIFIRYTEQAVEGDAKSGEVRTIIRYRPEELSIVRRGAIELEQLFTPGQRREGHYRSAVTTFPLETVTSMLSLQTAKEAAGEAADLPSKLPFTLEWQYEMFVSEQLSGRFHIRLHIQEELN